MGYEDGEKPQAPKIDGDGVEFSLQHESNGKVTEDITHAEDVIVEGITTSQSTNTRARPPAEYRDIPFAILFVVHLAVMLLILVGGFTMRALYHDEIVDAVAEYSDPAWNFFAGMMSFQDVLDLLIAAVICGVVGYSFAMFWLWLTKSFTRTMIYASILFSTVAFTVVGLFLILGGVTVGDGYGLFVGVVLILLGLLPLIFIYLWRNRIDFTVVLVKVTVGMLETQQSLYVVAGVSLAVYLLWFLVWAFAWMAAQSLVALQPIGAGACALFLIFCFYWTMEVVKNTVHVTIAGTMATWYFKSDDMDRATWAALKRATTTSFGSICFGSLIVALIQTLRTVVTSLSKRRGIVGLIMRLILGILERIVKFFNKFAFTEIAIYGYSYTEAAKATFDLLTTNGIDVVMNDILIGRVISLGAIAGALISATLAAVIAYLFHSNFFWVIFVAGLFAGYGMVVVSLEVLDSAITALMVCWCHEPEILQVSHPELYGVLYKRFGYRCQSLFRRVSSGYTFADCDDYMMNKDGSTVTPDTQA